MIQPSLKFKIIIGGDGGVGKTTILHRYVEGKFSFDTKMTIGADIFHKIITIKDGIICSLQLWDFGGQQRFRFLLDSFVRGASGAFLMFDLTNFITFDHLPGWVNLVREDDPTLPIIILGSKYDLKEYIQVDDETALDFIEDYDISGYYKVSSKSGYNVNEVFEALTQIIIRYNELNSADQSVKI
ncbi:MAG: Rab family GTPase [Promethearchaeota archaeon]